MPSLILALAGEGGSSGKDTAALQGILCLMKEAGKPTMPVAYERLQGEGWQVTPGLSLLGIKTYVWHHRILAREE